MATATPRARARQYTNERTVCEERRVLLSFRVALIVIPVKRLRGGAGTHTEISTSSRDTHGTHGRTRAHGSHRRTSQPSKPNDTPARPRTGRNRGRINSRMNRRGPGADRFPRPTQKRPPPANPTLPPPAPRAPPRACSKAVGEMKARAADAETRNGRGRCGQSQLIGVKRFKNTFTRHVTPLLIQGLHVFGQRGK